MSPQIWMLPFALVVCSSNAFNIGRPGIYRIGLTKQLIQKHSPNIDFHGQKTARASASHLSAEKKPATATTDAQLSLDPALLRRLKVISFLALVLQNSGLAIVMRYSRIVRSSSTMYITTTAVVVCEFVKIIVSLFGCLFGGDGKRRSLPEFTQSLKEFSTFKEILTISLPAALYVLQNNLQYIAVSNLPAEVYQVLVQSKTITTALFSAIILSRKYSNLQWLAVCALTVGVGLVQFSFGSSKVVVRNLNLAIGIPAVLISAITSGLAGVYTEKMMKSKNNFWIRNLQLSIVSFFMAILGVLVNDYSAVRQKGFFFAYDHLVLLVILIQALGGFLVALVIRYTDSIVKGFASAGSIILSCLLSSVLLGDYRLNSMFLTGTAITCTSAFAWGAFPTKANSLLPPANTDASTNTEKDSGAGASTAAVESVVAVVEEDESQQAIEEDKE